MWAESIWEISNLLFNFTMNLKLIWKSHLLKKQTNKQTNKRLTCLRWSWWALVLRFIYSVDKHHPLWLLFSHQAVSNSSGPHRLQHARLPCPSPPPRVCPSSCPLNRWCHLTISSSVTCSPSALNLSQHQDLFQWASCLHQMATVVELQLQHQSFQRVVRTDFL